MTGAVVETACDLLSGETVTVWDFAANVAANAPTAPAYVAQQVQDDVMALLEEMDAALNSGDPETAATVVVMCFTAQQLS